MEYPSNSLNMMDAWMLVVSEEELAALGLYPGDDATYAAELWGLDAYTLENVIVSSASCMDAVEESAASLIAASTTLLAIALLN